MLKRTVLTLFLAAVAVVPFAVGKAEAAAPISEKDQIARVNWNINIGGFCGGYCGPCYYPYYYPCPPPCAYPYPYPPYGGYWW